MQETGTFGIGIREISCQNASDLISTKSFLRGRDFFLIMLEHVFEGRTKTFSQLRWKNCYIMESVHFVHIIIRN